jgi:hypothetical protein
MYRKQSVYDLFVLMLGLSIDYVNWGESRYMLRKSMQTRCTIGVVSAHSMGCCRNTELLCIISVVLK